MGSSGGRAHPPGLAPRARRPSGAHEPLPCQRGIHAPRWGAAMSGWGTGGCASPCGRGFPPATLTGPARAGKCANPLLLFHRKQGETFISCGRALLIDITGNPFWRPKTLKRLKTALGSSSCVVGSRSHGVGSSSHGRESRSHGVGSGSHGRGSSSHGVGSGSHGEGAGSHGVGVRSQGRFGRFAGADKLKRARHTPSKRCASCRANSLCSAYGPCSACPP